MLVCGNYLGYGFFNDGVWCKVVIISVDFLGKVVVGVGVVVVMMVLWVLFCCFGKWC